MAHNAQTHGRLGRNGFSGRSKDKFFASEFVDSDKLIYLKYCVQLTFQFEVKMLMLSASVASC